jgi:hypothetical protein
MNSNSTERTQGWRRLPAGLLPAAVVVLAIVGGLEVATRCVLAPASNDYRSFSTYPGKAAALDASPALRIAVVGNSTARSGVDGDVLGKLLTTALGRPVTASLFVADSAEVTTWHFMLRRFFWRPRLKADMVVLLYYGDGLFDSREPEIGRLAQFFSVSADIPELFRDYLPRIGQRIEYLACAWWMTYAARDRLRERTLKALVPDHALYSRRVNDWQYAHRPAVSTSQPSFRKLERLLAEARANGTQVVVVALPTASSRRYEVPDALVATVEQAGMTFLDDRVLPELPPDLFPDGLHLVDEGKAIYTPLLAAELARIVPPEPSPRGRGRSDHPGS